MYWNKNVNDYIIFREVIYITIRDVATKCGVSVATVSRVLNGSVEVKKETRELVLEVVKKLNYQPNFTGRNLRKKETKLILILLPTIVNPFFAKVVKGMEDFSRNSGYNIMLGTTYENKEIEHSYLNLLRNKLVDGVIFFGTALDRKEIISLNQTYNILRCSEYNDDIHLSFVTIDNEKAAFEAVWHLIKCGCKNILYVTANDNSMSSINRLEGYKRALRSARIDFNPDNIIYGNYGYNSSYNLIKNKMEQGITFDGVFAISDKMASGCIKALKENGIDIPKQVKVVGFDNVDISYMTSPEITTISQPQYKIGETAIKMLIDKIQGKQVEKGVILEHKLIIRNSTMIGK